MSDWFGSGLNLSQFTDQLSSVLNESTAEVQDPATELAIAKDRIQQLENLSEKQLSEAERLKSVNDDLQEQKDGSELQIAVISKEYRQLLQHKESDLVDVRACLEKSQTDYEVLLNSALKQDSVPASQNGVALHSGQSAPSQFVLDRPSGTSTPNHSTSGLANGVDSFDGGFASSAPYAHLGDDAWAEDVSDVMSTQTQVNQLSKDLTQAITECQHWKKVAQALQRSANSSRQSATSASSPTSSNDVYFLHNEVKRLQEEHSREVDNHQSQLAALQQLHQVNLASQQQAHNSTLDELHQRLADFEDGKSPQHQQQQSSDSGAERQSSQVSSGGLENNLLRCTAENQQLQQQIASLEASLSAKRDSASKKDDKYRQAVAEKSQLEGELAVLRKEKEDGELRFSEQSSGHVKELVARQAELERITQERDKSVASLSQDLERTQHEHQTLKEEHSVMLQMHQESVAHLAEREAHSRQADSAAAPCANCNVLTAQFASERAAFQQSAVRNEESVNTMLASHQHTLAALEKKVQQSSASHAQLLEHVKHISSDHDSELLELAEARDQFQAANELLSKRLSQQHAESAEESQSQPQVQDASDKLQLSLAEDTLKKEEHLRRGLETELHSCQGKLQDLSSRHNHLISEMQALQSQHEAMQQASLRVSEQMKFREAAFEQLRTEYSKLASSGHPSSRSGDDANTGQHMLQSAVVSLCAACGLTKEAALLAGGVSYSDGQALENYASVIKQCVGHLSRPPSPPSSSLEHSAVQQSTNVRPTTQCQECAALKDRLQQALVSLKASQEQSDLAAHNASATIQRMQLDSQRLKHHLVQKEDEHNRELSELAQRDQMLLAEVAKLQQQLQAAMSTSWTQQSALSQELSQLRQSSAAISTEKDALQRTLIATQDQADGSGTTVARLQLVLEQFQAERESELSRANSKAEEQIRAYQRQALELGQQIQQIKVQYEEAIHSNKEVISLKEHIAKLTRELDEQKEMLLRASTELQASRSEVVDLRMTRVDRHLVKSLLLSYLSAPIAKRDEALHPIAKIFGFHASELAKISNPKKSQGSSGGWLRGWWGGSSEGSRRPSASSPISVSSGRPFTELFVEFLESESKPSAAGRSSRLVTVSSTQLPATAADEKVKATPAMSTTLDRQELARLPLLPTLGVGRSSMDLQGHPAPPPNSLKLLSSSFGSSLPDKV